MRPVRLLPILVVLAATCMVTAVPAVPPTPVRGFPTPTRWRGWAPELRRADSLLWAYRAADASVAARTLSQRARGERAEWPEMAASLIGSAADGLLGRGAEAEAQARRSLALARRLRDRDYERRSMRWMAFALETQARSAAAESTYRALWRAAVPARDTLHMGAAQLGIGYAQLQRGALRAARDHYSRAVPLLLAARNPVLHATARVGLARTLHGLGDFDGEERIYMEVLAQARRAQVGRNEIDAMINLGAIEHARGDAARAVRWWTLARERLRVVPAGDAGGMVISNLALALHDLGRWDEANALIDSAIVRARAANQSEAVALLYARRAEQLLLRDRPGEARDVLRSALRDLPAGHDLARARVLVIELRARSVTEPFDAAVEFAERELLPLLERLPSDDRVEMLIRFGTLQLEGGQPARALASLDRALRDNVGAGGDRSRAAVVRLLRGHALRDLGRRAEALASYDAAIRDWEAWRSRHAAQAWQDFRTFPFGWLPVAREDLALEGHERQPARLAASWEALERMRARTVLDRLQGGEGAAFAAPSLARVRAVALAPGDLLLDFHTSNRGTLLFAITRSSARVVRLAPSDSLAKPSRALFGLLASAPAPGTRPDAAEASLSRVARQLLGDVATEVRRARRVILVPDGALALAPLEAMVADVAAPAAPTVWRTPSASALLALRGRPRSAQARVLAWRGADDAGSPLRGADEEIAWLGSHLAGTDVRDGRRADAPPDERTLAAYDVLHFAGHARALEQSPWESGLLVADSAASGGAPWLTARRISSMRLRARLAFLSGCSTANGRVLDGEGVAGLATAFHAAGVGAVVATLWPVDDAATARFSAAFYARLGAGDAAATALAAARQVLRRDPETAHPHWWAGFVLSGDGAVRPPLRRR